MDGSNLKTTFSAVSFNNKNSIDAVYITLGYNADALLSAPLQDVATALNVTVYGSKEAQIKLPNGFSFSGSARACLKKIELKLKTENIHMMVDNGEIVLYKDNGDSRYSAGFLDYDSGLLEAHKTIDDKNKGTSKSKVSIKSILNHKYKPDSVIKVKSNNVNGVYIIDSVEYEGNNYGGNFQCSMEALE